MLKRWSQRRQLKVLPRSSKDAVEFSSNRSLDWASNECLDQVDALMLQDSSLERNDLTSAQLLNLGYVEHQLARSFPTVGLAKAALRNLLLAQGRGEPVGRMVSEYITLASQIEDLADHEPASGSILPLGIGTSQLNSNVGPEARIEALGNHFRPVVLNDIDGEIFPWLTTAFPDGTEVAGARDSTARELLDGSILHYCFRSSFLICGGKGGTGDEVSDQVYSGLSPELLTLANLVAQRRREPVGYSLAHYRESNPANQLLSYGQLPLPGWIDLYAGRVEQLFHEAGPFPASDFAEIANGLVYRSTLDRGLGARSEPETRTVEVTMVMRPFLRAFNLGILNFIDPAAESIENEGVLQGFASDLKHTLVPLCLGTVVDLNFSRVPASRALRVGVAVSANKYTNIQLAFLLAHEVAHMLLHGEDSTYSEAREMEADRFALNILPAIMDYSVHWMDIYVSIGWLFSFLEFQRIVVSIYSEVELSSSRGGLARRSAPLLNGMAIGQQEIPDRIGRASEILPLALHGVESRQNLVDLIAEMDLLRFRSVGDGQI